MKLKSVRITDFKCIEDSGEFSVGQVTCLVGKNESGKTALLQALHKLNPEVEEDASFTKLEYPRRRWSEYKDRHEEEPANVLTTVWELEAQDREAVEEALGTDVLKDDQVTIRKGYGNEAHWDLKLEEERVVKHFLASAELTPDERDALANSATAGELIMQLEKVEEPSPGQQGLLAAIAQNCAQGDVVAAAADILGERLPGFLYFPDYGRMAGQVSINDLNQRQATDQLEQPDRIFLALLSLAGTGPAEISEIGAFEALRAELEAVSNRLSEEIFSYWSQNTHLRVVFTFDHAQPNDPPPFNQGWVFRTRVENMRHKASVGFDERSSGFIWFFSFLVWFSQVRRNYGDNLVLLLDEPALNLHARAQADWLRYINDTLAPEFQVIYTTHSPFMIDADNLLSVRTVEDLVTADRVEGTKVGDRVFSIDPDTISPLQAALGYDITQTLFVGKHTLLVEGPSDLLYLKWFASALTQAGREGLDPRWVIAPCGGLDKVSSFVALFRGTDLHVAVLADVHKGEKQKVSDLRKSKLLAAGHVFTADTYAGQSEADIEDVIGRAAYADLVGRCYSLQEEQRLPGNPTADAPVRVAQEVREHFRTLPPEMPEFDHFRPATFLAEHTGELAEALPQLDAALERFEKLFKALNGLLPSTPNG